MVAASSTWRFAGGVLFGMMFMRTLSGSPKNGVAVLSDGDNKYRAATSSSNSPAAAATSDTARIARALEMAPIGSMGPKGTSRARYGYYDSLFFLTMQYGRGAKSLLEVGCASDPFSKYLNWIEDRTCVAPYFIQYAGGGTIASHQLAASKDMYGVEFVEADFMTYEATPAATTTSSAVAAKKEKYDLLLCSQVVEHVPDPGAFFRKLIESAKTSIISVPYNWPPCGKICNHVTDHITLDTILEWSKPHTPQHYTIVKEGAGGASSRRIITVFTTASPTTSKKKKKKR